jgi:hypothetical protein
MKQTGIPCRLESDTNEWVIAYAAEERQLISH